MCCERDSWLFSMHTGVGVSDTQMGGFNDNDSQFCYDVDLNFYFYFILGVN